MRSRPFSLTLALLLATIAFGLLIRYAPLGLPRFLVKYGGSMLWALMLYWIVSALLPRSGLLAVAATTGLFTAAIEFAKLYHAPALDAFRLTLPGALLLGRFFSFWDIAAYWFAILIGAFLDRHLRLAARRTCC